MIEEEGLLRITNYKTHPGNPYYTVFHFKEKDRADFFRQKLTENNIWFEEDTDEKEGKTYYYYAVKKPDTKQAMYWNNYTIGKFRKPFIADKSLRVFVILLSILILGLTILSYVLSQSAN
jgi:hypothetical protein